MLAIIFGIIISIGCYFIWDWSNTSLFTYLGEAEISPDEWEMCYTYDLMTIPARIACFMCGVIAITVFILTWLAVYDILFVW